MAKTYVVKLEIDGVSESITSINGLEEAVASLENELKSAELGSEEFDRLSKQIKKAKKEINAFNPKKKAKEFDAFGKNVSKSFDLAGQSMSVLGEQGEQLAGVITKSQKAMSTAIGITSKAQELFSKSTKESGDKAVQSTKGIVGGFKNLVKGVKAGGKAMKAAIASTGIGLLVVAVGLLVEYWDDIKGLVNGVSSEQKKLNKEAEENVKTQEQGLEAITAQENSLRLQGKSEREIRDLKIAQTDEIITATQLQLEQMEATKKAQVEAAQRNKDIAEGVIAFLNAPIVMLLGAVDALTAGLAFVGVLDEATSLADDFTGGLAGMLFDPEEIASEGDAAIEETKNQLTKLKNARDGMILASNAEDEANAKEASDKAAAEKKKAEDQAAQDEADLIQKRKDEAQAIEDLNNELALLALENEFERAQLALDQQEAADLEAIAGAENFEEQKFAIQLKYTALSNELATTKAASDLALANQKADEEIKIAQEVADAEKAIQDAKINNIAQGFKLLSQIAGKSKAAQAISVIGENAVGIAKQIISTRAANAAAKLTPQAVATSGAAALPVIAANNISLGLGIASSVAATKKALQALKQGGDAGGGDTGGGGGGAPNLGTPEETANIDFSFLGDGDVSEVGETAPVQAYVLGADVSSTLEANQVIKDQSTL